MVLPVPRIQYCARCNADQWHNVRTRQDYQPSPGGGTTRFTVADAYTCRACGHSSNPDASCRHSPACFVAPGTRGANTSPQIRAELAQQARQANRRKWALGIPVIVAAVAFIVCAGIWFVHFVQDSDDKATGQPAAGRSAHCVLAYKSAETCESTDPKVDLAAVWLSNASACTFDISIQWADGSPVQPVTVPGGRSGQTVVGSHTYAKPGTYAIVATNKIHSGNCQTVDGHYKFTLAAG